jgi:hypothetical protein
MASKGTERGLDARLAPTLRQPIASALRCNCWVSRSGESGDPSAWQKTKVPGPGHPIPRARRVSTVGGDACAVFPPPPRA